MLNMDQDGDKEGAPPSPAATPETHGSETARDTDPPPPLHDETILEELGAIIDDARLYAAAELAFQKTRAGLLGKNIAIAAGSIVIALILLHIAIIALAVGLVIALEPLVSIWGAIAIVVGVMLLGVGWLGWVALGRARVIGEMFARDTPADSADPGDATA